MADNPLIGLRAFGQSIWQDYIRRDMLAEGGEMQRLIRDDGILGVTSNPAIFEKAINGSTIYDGAIQAALARQGRTAREAYEILTVEDVRRCADLFRTSYEKTKGVDGYVSLEVSPHLARDTEGTLVEARRLWHELGRPNVMIKVPGTKEGLPAFRQLIREGINVNVTLLFGLPRYQEVIRAFMEGLEQRAAAGESIERVASVASFFLSRIDTLLDPRLEKLAQLPGENGQRARGLVGKIAVASAKVAYQIYKEQYASPQWKKLAGKGARPQRLLWASTSTKNKAYSDVMYVEPLIGPDTVNTLPPETIAAYRDHGRPAARLEEGVREARAQLEQLAALDINIHVVTQQLEDEGVQKFIEPYDKLLAALEAKLKAARG